MEFLCEVAPAVIHPPRCCQQVPALSGYSMEKKHRLNLLRGIDSLC